VEKVTGIGGLFVRARDPASLARWYEEHLGVLRTPTEYGAPSWEQDAGPTVFEPFPERTRYFREASKQWMVNFRVKDLAAMVEQLRSHGVDVEVDAEVYPNGRFARLADPEGNPSQLWQPAAPDRGTASTASEAASGAPPAA
jgi:glyoxylase I family protein